MHVFKIKNFTKCPEKRGEKGKEKNVRLLIPDIQLLFMLLLNLNNI